MTANVVGRFVFFLCQLLALVLLYGDGLAQTGSLKHSPSEVVKRYLELDYKGARLDAMSVEGSRVLHGLGSGADVGACRRDARFCGGGAVSPMGGDR